jgi:hypothetical protein
MDYKNKLKSILGTGVALTVIALLVSCYVEPDNNSYSPRYQDTVVHTNTNTVPGAFGPPDYPAPPATHLPPPPRVIDTEDRPQPGPGPSYYPN